MHQSHNDLFRIHIIPVNLPKAKSPSINILALYKAGSINNLDPLKVAHVIGYTLLGRVDWFPFVLILVHRGFLAWSTMRTVLNE